MSEARVAELESECAQLAAGLELETRRAELSEELLLVSSGPFFSRLPLDLCISIFKLLSWEDRICCAQLCKGWAALLKDARAWETADLSRQEWPLEDWPALLNFASARAGHRLRKLNLEGWNAYPTNKEEEMRGWEAVVSVAAANSETLESLCISSFPSEDENRVRCLLVRLREVLQAAPHVSLSCERLSSTHTEAQQLLLSDGPFARVCMDKLTIECSEGPQHPDDDVLLIPFDGSMLASARQCSMSGLAINASRIDADVVVNFALSAHLSSLCLTSAPGAPSLSLSALTRLLAGGCLQNLEISAHYNRHDGERLLSGPLVPAFLEALRAAKLTSLKLVGVDMFGADPDPEDPLGQYVPRPGGLDVLAACTGHPTLCELDLSRNIPARDRGTLLAVCRALATLVSTPSQLWGLFLSRCQLEDRREPISCMADFFESLPESQLQALHLDWNRINEAGAGALLAAVQAPSSSLRILRLLEDSRPQFGGTPARDELLQQAMAEVRLRR